MQVDLPAPPIERGVIGGNQFDNALLAFVDRAAGDAVSALDR
jgi:hypothetical protein